MMEEERLHKRKFRAKADNNLELLANVHKKLGELYFSQERYDEAIEEYQEERKLWKNLGKSMYAAVANRMLGEIYSALGDFEEALRVLKEYFDVSKEENNLIEEQRALATIGRTYFFMAESFSGYKDEQKRREKLREAKQAYLLSLKICDKIHNVDRYELHQMRSRLMLNIGLVFECQGEIEKAVEHIEKAIAINVKADLFEDTFRCYSSLAALHHRQNISALSLKYYDLALETAERLPEKIQLMCETLSSKADVYLSVANYKAAKQALTKAYKMCKVSSEEKSSIEKHLKIAHILCDYEERLVKMSENDYQTMKQLYETMGDVSVTVKNFSKAVIYYEKMLECCEALGHCGKQLLPAVISLSQTYRDAGMYDEALKSLGRELDIWEDNAEESCKTSLNMVQVLEKKGESQHTIMDALKKSLDYAIIANNERLELKVLSHIFRVQEENGLIEDSKETLSKIEVIKGDMASLSSTNDEDEEEEEEDNLIDTPDILNEISLSDIIDEIETENKESSRVRHTRRQIQGPKLKRNEKGETQLQVACIAGNYAKVKQLIDMKHPVNVTDNNGWTPLHEVCNHGYIELVKLLLDNGANVNDPGGDGCEGITPLHDACCTGHLEIVELLLDRGASTDVKTNDNKTPYDFLMEWASSGSENLSLEDLGLFECLKERLRKGLDKVGLSTDSFDLNVKSVQPPLKEKKRKDNPTVFNAEASSTMDRMESKRRRTVYDLESSCSNSSESSDEEKKDDSSDERASHNSETNIFNPVMMEDNPSLEYQNVMKGLRKKQIHEPLKKKKTMKSGGFVKNDVGDDWLIDDMNNSVRPFKRRKIKNMEGNGMKFIGTLRKDVSICGEEMYDSDQPSQHLEDNEFHVMEEEPHEYQSFAKSNNENNATKQVQISLPECGFTHQSVEKPIQHGDIGYTSLVENETSVHTVKIHIENKYLLIPLPSSEISGLVTIDWLAKETAKRFQRLEGREPTVALSTKDGATLAADDPISVISEERELLANVTSWKSLSLLQRYKDICAEKGLVSHQELQDSIQACDISGCLNLLNKSLSTDVLAPLVQSFQHEYSLKELILGNNVLMDEGLQMLLSVKGLPQLKILDLHCNNISSRGLKMLCPFLVNCQSLQLLDLSFNDMEERGWLDSISCVCESLLLLGSLNLQACGLSAEEIGTRKDYLHNRVWSLETINISENPLEENGLRWFLHHLDPNRISHLNVAGTSSSSCMNVTMEFLKRGSLRNLHSLNVSRCFVTDDDLKILLGCLQDSEHLYALILCYNKSLSPLSLETLNGMPNMPPVLDLCGCDIFSLSDDNLNCNILEKLQSLTITLNSNDSSSSVIQRQRKIHSKWKELWGDSAKVIVGSSGLMKLNVIKSDEM